MHPPAPCGRGLGGGVSRRQARMNPQLSTAAVAAMFEMQPMMQLFGALPRADPAP
jgi:hypothetical protein